MKKSRYFTAAALLVAFCCYFSLLLNYLPVSVAANDVNDSYWLEESEVAPPSDYAYSFAIVGDTQIVNRYTPDKFTGIYDYLVENVESQKIKHIFGLGDITDADTAAEWTRAKTEIARLDGLTNYTIIRGNHDSLSNFNQYFGYGSAYGQQLNDFYGIDYSSGYQIFSAGQLDYLVLTLDYGASDEVLAWASQVVAEHPFHNVIVTTHGYLDSDGSLLDDNGTHPPTQSGGYNNGDDMWDKFIRKHENIVLVLSGHIDCSEVLVSTLEGDHGNTVTQMLVNPQGMDKELWDAKGEIAAMIAMLYFSEDGRDVTVRWYSTAYEKFYDKNSQYTISINTVREETDSTEEFVPTPTDGEAADPTDASAPTPTEGTNSPDTGDASDLGLALMVAFCCVGSVGLLVQKRRKHLS